MRFGLRNWRARHLLAAWGAYWATLAAVTLGSGVVAAWLATRGPDGHSSINASFGDGGFSLNVIRDGMTTWHGAATVGAVAFWVCGPPLLLWLAWLAWRPAREAQPASGSAADAPAAVGEGAARPALHAPFPESAMPFRPEREPVRARRDGAP